jgi:outer membrane protein assembly factor BamB
MTWRLLNSVELVFGNVQVNSNWLSHYLHDNTFCIREIHDNYKIKNEVKMESDFIYKIFGNDFYFFGHGTIYQLNPENNRLTELVKTDKQYIEALSHDLFLASSYSRKTKLHESQLLNLNSVKWEIFGEFGFRKCFGEVLVFSNNSDDQISRVDMNTGKESWAYNLPVSEVVASEIYAHNGVLVVPSREGQMPFDTTYLQGLDITTGELLWRRESNIYLYQNVKKGLLYAFGGDTYIVINPMNGKTVEKKEFKGLKENDRLLVSSTMSRLYGDGLYFTSDYVENHYDCQFGKINIDNHEIEFIQKLDVAEGVTAAPPIYNEGRLYIKDSLNTLHIYEQRL